MKAGIKDKSLAKGILMVLLVFLGYLFYVFIPIWIYAIANSEGTAKVISLSENEIIYSYYNVYKGKEIKLRRDIDKTSYLKKIHETVEFKIRYSKSLSGYVIFIGIDRQTPISMTLFITCLTLISIWLYILVIKGRISLKTLFGID